MTQSVLAAVVRWVLTIVGAILVKKGATDNDTATMIVGGAPLIAAIVWSIWHKTAVDAALNGDGPPPAKPPEIQFPTNLVPFLVLVAGLAGLCGCASIYKQHENVVSATESVFGMDISQSQVEQTPHVRIGFIRTQFHVVPTVRQSNEFIWTPAVVSSIDVDSHVTSNRIEEDFATGKAAEDFLGGTNTFRRRIGKEASRATNAVPAVTNAPAGP